MAVSQQGKGWITIVDLNDNKVLNFGLSTNHPDTQIHNQDAGTYVPNYTTSNLVVTPFLYISGESTSQMSQVSNVTWTINGSATTSWGTVSNNSPYALTINKNLVSDDAIQIKCTGKYTDPTTSVQTTIVAERTITKLNTAGSTLSCILSYPTPYYFYNNQISNIQITAQMYSGSTPDDTSVGYKWYRFSNGGWQQISTTNNNVGTIENYNGKTIKIYPDDILDRDQFKCRVTDNDSTSGNYQQWAEAVSQTIVDLTDPYEIQVFSTCGNILLDGAQQTTLRADVYRSGQRLNDNDNLYSTATFTWTKADKNGNPVSNWNNGSATKTGRSIPVTRDEIDIKATFFCTLTI